MGQDMTMTKRIGDAADTAATGVLGTSDAPRRRLGNWQVPPGVTDQVPPRAPAIPAAATVSSEQTVPLPGHDAMATAPLAANPFSVQSAPASRPPVAVAVRPIPVFVPSASDSTLPYSEREAKRVEWEDQQALAWERQQAQDATSELSSRSDGPAAATPALDAVVTAPMRAPVADLGATAPMGSPDVTRAINPVADASASTVPLVHGDLIHAAVADTAELSQLRRRTGESPDDLDLQLELGLALREVGRAAEATVILTSLAAICEEQGSPDEAIELRRLIASAPTVGIGAPAAATMEIGAATASTVELGSEAAQTVDIGSASAQTVDIDSATARTTDISASSAATVDIGPGSSPGDETVPLARSVGRTTLQLASRTVPLHDRLSPSRDGRRQAPVVEASAGDLFPRGQLVLTDPLPMADALTQDGAEVFGLAEAELASGQLRASLDTLNLAITLSPTALGLWVRMAEIRLLLGHRRKAQTILEQLGPLTGPTPSQVPSWMVGRLLLHTGRPSAGSMRQVVDQLTEAGQMGHASTYASALIHLLDDAGDSEAALASATQMTATLPGDTRIALEGAVLAAKHGSHGEVIDLWELAVSQGADEGVARASMAASVASASEDDHWRLLSATLHEIRADGAPLAREAYLRTAEASGSSPVLTAGRALVLHAIDDESAKDALAAAAGDRAGSSIGRAAASIALAYRLSSVDKGDEYVAAVRTTLTLMASDTLRAQPDWIGLIGIEPDLAELSTELGETLLDAGDAAGAVEIMSAWHRQAKQHAPLVRLLAEAYARTGQPGSALSILDELGMHHRKAGELDEMAAVLRQMSRLAPTNIKVKSRLIDAYLQRGFVSEARAELIQRADLEEQAGLVKEACKSLQRAADLSWNLGMMNDAFGLYDRLLALDPEDVGNRSGLVNLYLQVGQMTEAAEHQRVVVDIALRHGRRHEAIAALHQVIGLTPDDMTAYYQLGELLTSMSEYRQAEKVYRRIVLMSPDDAVAQAKATAIAALKEQMEEMEAAV